MDEIDINRLIAEKVMQYVFSDLPLTDEDKPTPRVLWMGKPKPYSTDISAAFEVVEKMREKGYLLSLYHQHRQADGSYHWEAQFEPEDESDIFAAIEDTAPLAICKAALSAIK